MGMLGGLLVICGLILFVALFVMLVPLGAGYIASWFGYDKLLKATKAEIHEFFTEKPDDFHYPW